MKECRTVTVIDDRPSGTESGFSYIDVLIAIGLLMTGIVALLSAMTAAIATSGRGQQQLMAKQYATSTMESIFSARDINNPNITSFAVIRNDTTTGGLFLTGRQPMFASTGADGIIGTRDDGWGLDGRQGTSDDLSPINGFSRQITITPVSAGLIQIDVTIYYMANGLTFSQSLSSYMANYNTQKFN